MNTGESPNALTPTYRLPRFEIVDLLHRPQYVNLGQRLLGLESIWQRTRGADVTVGIVDTGIDANHEDLAPALTNWTDFTNSSYGPADEIGHGTHVAGIVAARDNNVGVIGVAPEASLLSAKIMRYGQTSVSPDVMARAIRWCVHEGADVICISFSSPSSSHDVRDAIEEAIEANVAVICAAGNTGPSTDSVEYPARFPETIAVGYLKVGPNMKVQYVPRSSAGRQLDLLAPGGAITSTWPINAYAECEGSSMAAPFVAGVAALILSREREQNPDARLVQRALEDLFRDTAYDHLADGDFNLRTGWGLIAPARVLSA